jgi:argininosuccinate synthase
MTERIVLAYSGGAADTAAIRLFAGQGAEVVTVTLDVGQARDAGEIRDRAIADGAARAHVLDVREEFARDHALPALRGEALPDVTGLAAPLIAATLVEIGRIENARVESTGSGAGPNLLCRPVADLARTPDTAAQVELVFEAGVPASINGVPMALTELLESLALIGGRHGVGRVDDIEAPAAVLLHTAYRALNGRDGLVGLSLLKGQHTLVTLDEHASRAVRHA